VVRPARTGDRPEGVDQQAPDAAALVGDGDGHLGRVRLVGHDGDLAAAVDLPQPP